MSWRIWLCVLLLPAFLGACSGQSPNEAIILATRQYLTDQSVPAIDTMQITVEKVVEPFARVEIDTTDDSAEPATAFLKFDNGTWNVLTLGTAFDRETYEQFNIPLDLQV